MSTFLRSALWVPGGCAVALSFLVACGGGAGGEDTGTPGLDARGSAADAPGTREDAPSVGLDAPARAEDAPMTSMDDATASGEDAPSVGDDAPSSDLDAYVIADDAFMGALCDRLAGVSCGPGQYCDDDCGTPEPGGVCRDTPTTCTDEVNVVCGCDGVTYVNPCRAAVAGTHVLAAGRCGGAEDCRTAGCGRGQECCTIGRAAGACYDPACLACCM